jgi:hypothetical protein
MDFANWYLPATCFLLRTPELNGHFPAGHVEGTPYSDSESAEISGPLHAGHRYKFVLTVLHEEKELGTAKVEMHWVTGGDSM